jgi:hypothetical protein
MRWMLADPRNRLECWNAVNHCLGLDRLLTRSVLDIVLVWLFRVMFGSHRSYGVRCTRRTVDVLAFFVAYTNMVRLMLLLYGVR